MSPGLCVFISPAPIEVAENVRVGFHKPVENEENKEQETSMFIWNHIKQRQVSLPYIYHL